METKLQAKKDFSRMGFALIVISAVSTLLQVLLSFFLRNTPLGDSELSMWLITFVPLYLVGVPAGLLILRKIPSESLPASRLGIKRFFVLMLICMPIMYGGNLIGTLMSSLLSGGTAENALLDYIMGNPLYTILVAVIAAPIIEEYIFRKQIIDRLGKYGELTAILFSAVTFGLFHMNLFQFFYAFGLGLIFAYVYTRTRKLRYPILMHMIINFQGSVLAPWILSVVDPEALAAMQTGEIVAEDILSMLPGLLAMMVYSYGLLGCVIAGLVLLIVNWKKRQFLPATQELPAGSAGKTAYINLGMILFGIYCLIMIVLALFV